MSASHRGRVIVVREGLAASQWRSLAAWGGSVQRVETAWDLAEALAGDACGVVVVSAGLWGRLRVVLDDWRHRPGRRVICWVERPCDLRRLQRAEAAGPGPDGVVTSAAGLRHCLEPRRPADYNGDQTEPRRTAGPDLRHAVLLPDERAALMSGVIDVERSAGR